MPGPRTPARAARPRPPGPWRGGDGDRGPPPSSAKRVGGERAHRLARRGAAVTLAPARVDIQRFDLVERSGSDARFEATVGSGTYLRSLAPGLGEALGGGAP